MFLRLCVVVSLFTVQAALAQTPDDQQRAIALSGSFEGELKMNQQDMPAGCQIKSPAMKVAYACSKLQTEKSNPRFYGSIDAGEKGSPSSTQDGVNYCYNSLVNVEKNGDVVRVQVLRDVGSSANRTSYTVKQSNLKAEGGEYVLPLANQKGQCFARGAANAGNCGSDVEMTPKVTFDSQGNVTQSMTADRRAITAARRNGAQLNSPGPEVNSDESSSAVIAYGRQQLVARAKEKMANPGPMPGSKGLGGNLFAARELDAYKLCDQMVINMENSLKTKVTKDPEEEKTLNSYRAQIKSTNPYDKAGGKGDGSGVREGK